MHRLAFVALYRSLTRDKLYAALTIGGLAVGIATFLVLALYVRFETSFERWVPRHDRIYRVDTEVQFPAARSTAPIRPRWRACSSSCARIFPG